MYYYVCCPGKIEQQKRYITYDQYYLMLDQWKYFSSANRRTRCAMLGSLYW